MVRSTKCIFLPDRYFFWEAPGIGGWREPLSGSFIFLFMRVDRLSQDLILDFLIERMLLMMVSIWNSTCSVYLLITVITQGSPSKTKKERLRVG